MAKWFAQLGSLWQWVLNLLGRMIAFPWRLSKRLWFWFDDRTEISATLGPVIRHKVPPHTGWAYVFGSATLTCFLVQVVTGTALALAYVPSTSQAYDTLNYLSTKSTFGHLLRGMHYYGASGMIICIGLHMSRVFLMASYKYPREVNWLGGVVLLLLTLGMGFTGQLLRWDQNAVWSAVVAAEQAGRMPLVGHALARLLLGGDTFGGMTLTRFFAAHVFFVPGLLFAFIGLHLYLVIKNGISEPPVAGELVDPKTYRKRYEELLEKKGVPFWPDAAWRDAVFAAVVVLVILLLALLVGPPPLDRAPDPTVVQADPRPDWYLLWYFAVLALLPHGTESVFIILAPLSFFVILVLIPCLFNKGERSPRRRPWAPLLVLSAMLVLLAYWVVGEVAPWSPRFDAELPTSVLREGSPLAAQGLQIFNRKACVKCHKIDGTGGLRGPDLSTVGAHLTEDLMVIRILNGGYNMPAFASNLKPEELQALLAFLRTRTGTASGPR